MERMRSIRRNGRDALLTRANVLSGARIVGGLDLVRRISDSRTSSLELVTEHVGVSITDFLDGKFAREDGPTALGEFLDPLADKVQVLGELLALSVRGDVPSLPVAIIAARELAITKYRAGLKKEGINLPANRSGQIKTWAQLITIGLALLPKFEGKEKIVKGALWTSTAITLGSGLDLLRSGEVKRREKKLSESKREDLRTV